MKNRFGREGVTAALLATVCAVAAWSAPASAGEGVSAEALEQGQGLFLVNCRQCHGTKGTAGTPLASNHKLEDPAYVAHTIIDGRGYMTAFGEHLDDAQIAAIATFVRNSWGNDYGPVTPDEVAAAR